MEELSTQGRRLNTRTDIGVLAAELDLAPEQQPVWRDFVEIWLRAEHDRQKIDGIVQSKQRERAPGLPDALRMEAQSLIVRLDSAQRLEEAARNLYKHLSPRQKSRADRLLSRLCMEAVRSAASEDGKPVFDPLISVSGLIDGGAVSKQQGMRSATPRHGAPTFAVVSADEGSASQSGGHRNG
jgi:hypothetical protein